MDGGQTSEVSETSEVCARQQKFNRHRLGEFGRGAPAPVSPVVGIEEVFLCQREMPGRELRARAGCGLRLDVLDDLPADALDLVALVFPRLRKGGEHVAEGGQVVTRHGREVGTPVKWMQFGSQKDRHRPAASARQDSDRLHVDSVQVGAFLAVHFDVDEILVHQRGDGVVFETFLAESVAPMTRAVTNA